MGLLVVWLVVINIATHAAFAADKRAAEAGAWRIPERTLLGMAAVGGTPAAFAARSILRHKTQKQPFSTYLFLIAGAQVLLILGLFDPDFRATVVDAISRELR